MLQVLEAGLLCGSTLGVGGTGRVGGASLGGFVWGTTLVGVSGNQDWYRCGGISIWGVAAASENIVLRRVSSLWWDSWRRWGKWPLIAVMRFPDAAMIASAVLLLGLKDTYDFEKRLPTLGLRGC